MICRVLIDASFGEKDYAKWNELTNGANVPDFIEMDIPCVPMANDDYSVELTYGKNVVEVSGRVESRTLYDGRRNENLTDKWKTVYFWIHLDEIKVCLYDTIR